MSLPQLLYPPPTENGWNEWLHSHLRHHEALISAIMRTKGENLVIDSPLYPVDLADKDQKAIWDRSHQNIHNRMNALLNIPSQDIALPDLKDRRAADGWFFLHLQQHEAAAQRCGEPV